MIRVMGRVDSSNVQKVLWCLREIDLPFDREDIGGVFGRNRDADFLALNPNGRIPVLLDGDLVLWESNSILRYLAARYGANRFWIEDPGQRAMMERWMDWQLSVLHAPMVPVFVGLVRTPPEQRNEDRIANSITRWAEAWDVFERGIGTAHYLAGESLSIADIAVGVLAYRWFELPIERPALPRLEAWYDRLATRPPFQASVAIGLS